MKTLILAALALAPFPARAATSVGCDSAGLRFTIASPTSLTKRGAEVRISASGLRMSQFPAVVSTVESAGPAVVVNIATGGPGEGENASTIHARIELATEPHHGGQNIMSGSGQIVITKFPEYEDSSLRLRSVYPLRNCVGVL